MVPQCPACRVKAWPPEQLPGFLLQVELEQRRRHVRWYQTAAADAVQRLLRVRPRELAAAASPSAVEAPSPRCRCLSLVSAAPSETTAGCPLRRP